MNFSNFLKSEYWFSQPSPAVKEVYWVWVGGLLILVAIGIFSLVAKMYLKDKTLNTFLDKLSSLGLTTGILGLIFFFFRQQNVFLLGYRMWFLLWGILFLVWAIKVLKYYFKRIPEIKSEQQERMRKQKYLP